MDAPHKSVDATHHRSVTSLSARMRAILPPGAVVLGPMAGITEAPFRGICKRMGAALTYTEMVSAMGLRYHPDSVVSRTLLTFSAEEVPCAVQLFGAQPEIIAEQSLRILERYGSDVALIDINMGCPVTKVVNRGEGCGLMRTPKLAARIVERVVASCNVPVTVKFRSGWDSTSMNAVEFARVMEAAGAAAVAVHGRTRERFYRGKADWDVIASVKSAVSIPVIGSGDVFSAADAKAMFEHTGVDAVMVARGARGNPWLFREARALIDTGETIASPTGLERVDMAREHARALLAFGGERTLARTCKHVAWYIHALPDAAKVRKQISCVADHNELDELLLEYRAYLETRSSMLESAS